MPHTPSFQTPDFLELILGEAKTEAEIEPETKIEREKTMVEDFQWILAGNPNSGKSTIFNMLTGARQHVGNYPGVTVEKMEGRCKFQGRTFSVVDLPGAYSLNAHSEDEEAARRYLFENRDKKVVLINVLDASNFERSLFLTLQLLELKIPMILVLNMADLARARGIAFQKDEIEPIMKPMGMDWKIGTAFLGAFAAKEVFVAEMGIVYRVGDVEDDDSSLREIVSENYSPLSGLCILLFALIATPCMATFAVMARETGSWKWAFGQWFALSFLAWIVCAAVFQIGTHVFGL